MFMRPKGRMTTELFCKWLEHFVTFKMDSNVLIFDGATSHLDIGIVNKAKELIILLLKY